MQADLETASTEDLLDELLSRFDQAAFIGTVHLTGRHPNITYQYTDDGLEVQGLVGVMGRIVCREYDRGLKRKRR